MVASMIFNGHTEEYVESLSEDLFTEILVMYADGMLGNKGIFDALTPVTAGIFNYLRPASAAAVKPEEIFPWINEYLVNPDLEPSPEEKVNNALLTYVTGAKGFSKDKFK